MREREREMWHAWGDAQVFWLENHIIRDKFGDISLNVRIILKGILKKQNMKIWTKFS
jgi:hypothetical protein